jgi:predicted site-specific integrase-resolvase
MVDRERKDPLVNAEAGAEFLGIRANTLRKWARLGYVDSVRVRSAVRFRLSALEKLITKRICRDGYGVNGDAS